MTSSPSAPFIPTCTAASSAALTPESVTSLPHLSVQAPHRRGWGSLYGALAAGRLDGEALRATLAQDPITDGHPVDAVDLSVWPRCDAEASPERGFSYHPSRHSVGQPIVAGWAYQWRAQLSFTRDSWTAPLDVRRVHPTENVHTVAVAQIAALRARRPASEARPLFVFDAGYDAAHLTQAVAEIPVAILVRLRADRCFSADPPLAMPSPKGGRPRKHGAMFAGKDPATWPVPTAEHCAEDEQYGIVRVRSWAGLHPKQQNHPGRSTRKTRPIVRGTIVLVEVSRLPADRTRRHSSGCGGPDRERRTWTCCGARMSAASIWSTRCAFASRTWDGRRPGFATPSKPIAGRGSSWQRIPSCGWRGRGLPIADCPGSGRSRWGH